MAHHTPHDAFVKAIFSTPARAAELLRRLLHPDVSAAIDWRRLEPLPTESIGDDLVGRRADLIFQAPLADKPAVIVVLLEHQSSVDPRMPVRALLYGARFWQSWLAEHPTATRIPAVLPVVLYHGPAPWTAATGLLDLIDLPPKLRDRLAPHLPSMELVIDDLARTPDEAIEASTRSALVTAALLMLKHTPYDETPVSDRLVEHLAAAVRAGEVEPVVQALHYVYNVSDLPPGQVEERLIRGLPREDGEVIMTTAERLRAEGRAEGRVEGRAEARAEALAEGRAEGRAEARAEILLEMLALKFGAVSETHRRQIATADDISVARWMRRFVQAERLEDIFA